MTHGRAMGGLVLVTLVWGATFTVVKGALADASPLVLVAARFGLATLLLLPLVSKVTRIELLGGLVFGLLFWGGIALQTTGLADTTPSRSAFITSLAAPLVPLVGWLVHGERPGIRVLGAIALATGGLYLLTDPGSGGPNRGDLLTAAGALLFAGHIVAVGRFTGRGDAGRLLLVQLGTTAVLAAAAAPILGSPRFSLSPALGLALAFLVSTAIGTFWFQIRAQRVLSPAETGLIFTLEPVFASLTSWIAIGETLSAPQWLGGALVVTAMSLSALRRQRKATIPGAA
ncbi:MAG TPA: DMT family transporter, partial [Gemmatimonadales bacterium]|nr:DMT family transporter [Gemmatimonadales bacterium]